MGAVLLQELMSCWTECAPGHLAAGPVLTAVQCMEATLQCVDMLLHQLPSLFPTGHLVLPSLPTLHAACTGSAMTVKHSAMLMSSPHLLHHTLSIDAHAHLVLPSLPTLHAACTGSAMTVKHSAMLMSSPHLLHHTLSIGAHAQCMTQKMWG